MPQASENKSCPQCKKMVDLWNEQCTACGVHLVMESDEVTKQRYLRGPSLGALLFTQGWTFGARLYVWFLLSLIPLIGLIVLFVCLFFGRRWSWKYGGWASFTEFRSRMRLLDSIAVGWVLLLIALYIFRRYF